MTVTISFQPPARENVSPRVTDTPITHERRLEAVPEPIAQQMSNDFVVYQISGSIQAPEVQQYRTYKYEHSGREVQIALDFGEILALDISRS